MNVREIEDALLALPAYCELENGRESLELRLATCYLAALYHAEFWKLKTFTNYPDLIIDLAMKKMNENDLVTDDNKIKESFVRNRLRGAGAIVDRILNVAPAPALEIVTEPAPAPAPATETPAATEMPIAAPVAEFKLSKAQIARNAALKHKGRFTATMVRVLVCAETGDDEARAQMVVNAALQQLLKTGEIVVVKPRQGTTGAVYEVATAGAAPAAKDAPVRSPKPAPQINRTAVMREAIVVVAGQRNGEGFSWPQVAEQLRATGHKHTEEFKQTYQNETYQMQKRGELQILQKAVRGERPMPTIYAKPDIKPEVNSIAAVAVNAQEEKVPAAPAHPSSELIPIPCPPPPSAPIIATAELLPGPTSGAQFVDHLVYLKNRAISDVEAISRVLGIIEREAAR